VRLPNAESAICDVRKLAHYCLDPMHPRGQHKARVFRQALAITAADADWLRQTLLDAVAAVEATEITGDAFGQRWRVDVPVMRLGRAGMVRTSWIVRSGDTVPRFVTCWVL
jgi:hypothetical protein